MNGTSNYLAVINQLLVHPTGGVVGFVNDFLKICREHHLELDWQRNRYLVRSGDGAWEEANSRDAHRLIFQVLMERLAVLCNEQIPDSVSLYGGKGTLRVTADEAFQIDFMNMPTERWLQLKPIRLFAAKEVNGAASGVKSEPIGLQLAGD